MGVQTAADVRINKKCLYKYNAEKYAEKKVMKINERWKELKEELDANIQSEK